MTLYQAFRRKNYGLVILEDNVGSLTRSSPDNTIILVTKGNPLEYMTREENNNLERLSRSGNNVFLASKDIPEFKEYRVVSGYNKEGAA